jgi:hypothetical protein
MVAVSSISSYQLRSNNTITPVVDALHTIISLPETREVKAYFSLISSGIMPIQRERERLVLAIMPLDFFAQLTPFFCIQDKMYWQ